jgi:hypothetical protein
MAVNDGSPMAVAKYLVSLKPLVASAIETRRLFVRELGQLVESARSGNTASVAQGAGRLGRERADGFRESHASLGRLRPPDTCAPCHEAVVRWVELHVEVCGVLIEVGGSGDLGKLSLAQDSMAEGRRAAQRFNAAYESVVRDLKGRVAVARREQAARERRAAQRTTAAGE